MAMPLGTGAAAHPQRGTGLMTAEEWAKMMPFGGGEEGMCYGEWCLPSGLLGVLVFVALLVLLSTLLRCVCCPLVLLCDCIGALVDAFLSGVRDLCGVLCRLLFLPCIVLGELTSALCDGAVGAADCVLAALCFLLCCGRPARRGPTYPAPPAAFQPGRPLDPLQVQQPPGYGTLAPSYPAGPPVPPAAPSYPAAPSAYHVV
eukprot:TRINITY_DN1184_c0_g1_i4.p2 TRINITY_DN1184_c0_g1~~TRINITY_DN1184_c0_g1_i4.p2  ORF type:complete len:202 (+),score=51.92 TRINITY_DN1184_c0_g1_i4:51-656(+)